MIISIAEAKANIDFKGWTDSKIERKLKAVEQAIRSYTNNNFQDRDYRRTADIIGGSLYVEALTPFDVGDTVMITETALNKGLFTVLSVDDSYFTVNESVKDEKDVLVTKVHYPENVVDCALKLLEWEVEFGGKVGIKSETLSRHSVTYEDSSTLFMGYPVGILNGLEDYMKARF
jgi:hypothetical protein